MRNPIYILLFMLLLCAEGYAQLNPLGTQYYNNQYLTNPAFAGHSEGLKLNGVYLELLPLSRGILIADLKK